MVLVIFMKSPSILHDLGTHFIYMHLNSTLSDLRNKDE